MKHNFTKLLLHIYFAKKLEYSKIFMFVTTYSYIALHIKRIEGLALNYWYNLLLVDEEKIDTFYLWHRFNEQQIENLVKKYPSIQNKFIKYIYE